VTPTDSQEVSLVGSEMDFMLARLDSVPAGSRLVFMYGPTAFEQASWGLSATALLALVLWLVRPELYGRGRRLLVATAGRVKVRLSSAVGGRLGEWGDEDEPAAVTPTGDVPLKPRVRSGPT
jgi:hypothetical protein